MDAVDALWNQLFQLDWISTTLVLIICSAAGAVMKTMLPSPALTYMAFPVMVVSAFSANSAVRAYGLTLGGEAILDVAAATCVGMTAGTLASLLLVRALLALGSR